MISFAVSLVVCLSRSPAAPPFLPSPHPCTYTAALLLLWRGIFASLSYFVAKWNALYIEKEHMWNLFHVGSRVQRMAYIGGSESKRSKLLHSIYGEEI